MNNNYNLKVLALKYRPKFFKDLIGQEIISETILNSIKSGKTPNAYLLTGIRGVGKTTTARLIAKALNCTKNSNNDQLCNEKDSCTHCTEIENSNHIDVLEMDAASKTGIDDVRELIESAKYNPTSSKYKIFIIDEIHMLSKQAFNGLLKTLEEPPQRLKFILATTEARKIPVTILSRCQRFDLKRVGFDKIYNHIRQISKNEKGKISDEALKLLSKASEGSVRDAISLLDRTLIFQNIEPNRTIEDTDVRKILGLADRSKLITLLIPALEGDEKKSIKILNDLIEDGLDSKNFLNDILELIYLLSRRINLGPIEKDLFISDSEIKLIDQASKNLNSEDLNLFWQLTLKTIEDLNITSNESITLEMYLMQLTRIKNIDEHTINENPIIDKLNQNPKIENSENKQDPIKNNNIKEQLKSINQVKALERKEIKNETTSKNQLNINSFADLINLAEKNKEMELKYDLERNVRVAKFENGQIDINFNEKLNKNFIRRLSQSLIEWTGKRWIISFSKNENIKTFHQKKLEKIKNILMEEKKSKTYKEVTNIFSDADLNDVRTKDE